MDHIVITIRPPSDEALLPLADAMRQVLDTLTVFAAAERGLGTPDYAFEWRLEKASTNSPFTVVARAEPRNPRADLTDLSVHVERVKAEVVYGIRSVVERSTPPPWLGPDEIASLRSVFVRHQSGIGETDIDMGDDLVVSITPFFAAEGLQAIAALNAAVDVAADLPDREAYGEIEGVMLAAGRYRNRPAIQLRSELYGFLWCTLSDALVERFGSEHAMSEIWEGKTVAVEGRLSYAAGGKLAKVEAIRLREVQVTSPIDLDAVLDPNFTAGLDPIEYLRRLNDGELS